MLNPWLVDTIEAFSFYCCPECTFKSNEPNFFQNHALKNHDLSKSLFDNTNLEEIKVKVKLENIEIEPGSQNEYLSETEAKVNSSSLLKGEENIDRFEDDLNNFDDSEDFQSNDLSNDIEVFCQECNVKVSKTNFWRHLRTKVHKENTVDQKKAKSDADTKNESEDFSKRLSRKNSNNKNIKKAHKNNSSKEIDQKGKSSSFVEDQDIWNLEFFGKMNERQLETYKYNWGTFCKLSYHNQQNPPTEEMYVDFIKKKKEAGRTDKALWNTYLVLKKVAFHVHGQKIQNFVKLKELLPYSSKEYSPSGPKIPKPGSNVDDSGVCPHCGDHFKWLQQHIVHKHEKSKPWKCEDCDYAHSLLAGLKRHKKTKHPDESTMKVCHICGHKAVTNQEIRKHIEATHEKKRDFACNVCEDTKFYSKRQLSLHVRVQHLGEKPFKCPDCDEAFKNSAKLGRHKRTVHTKEKYCCPVCGVEYNCLRSMKRHALKAHGVEHKHKRKNV